MKKILPAFLLMACTAVAQATIHTETVEYKQGNTTLEGYLAYDDVSSFPPGH
jgi:hypothetical protein